MLSTKITNLRKICLFLNFFSRLNEVIQNCAGYKSNIYDQQYKNLIEISPEPILILEKDRIIYINNSAQKLMKAEDIEDIKGKSIIDFVEHEYKSKAKESIYNLFNKKSDTIIAEVKVKKLSGEVCYVQGLAIEIVYNNSPAVLTMLRDITDIKEKETLLKKAKEEAEKAEKLKSQFLAQMSHEIRSPLNTIITSIQMFKEELMIDGDEEQNKYFRVIKSASKRIIRTIDLILISSELQNRLYQPIHRDIDLFLITNSLIYEYRNLAQNKNILLKFSCSCEDQTINADEYSVTQILSNLLDNAIKYTDEGSIEVDIFRNETKNLVVRIKDTGKGISENFLENIFCEFTQEDYGYNRKYEGTGLGMAIVKKFCELNNAEIKIESFLNEGTTVFVTF